MAETLREDDENQEHEEIVIVEDDPNQKKAENAEENEVEAGDDQQGDERTAQNESDDEDRDEIRERRRKEKQERKERREKAIARDKLELDFLRKRNDELERRISVTEQRQAHQDINQIDAQIAEAQKQAQLAERVIAKAIEKGNGEDVAQALRYRDEAVSRFNQLSQHKQSLAAKQAQPQQQQIDDLTLTYAKRFIEENSWYDPQGRDEDSAIVLAIDQGLVRDGYDSKSEEYWTELRNRVARRLPGKMKPAADDRYDDDEPAAPQRKPRGGPAVGSGREHAPATTRKEIYISPERKQALIDAGVWDDPVLRMKYVKRYAEYDRSQKRS